MHVIEINTKHGFAKHEFDLLSVPAKGNLKVRKAEVSDAEEASDLVASHLKSATVSPLPFLSPTVWLSIPAKHF